jgi:murein DD-endopeptidase MepM/ murein hydrolase activator NlpD
MGTGYELTRRGVLALGAGVAATALSSPSFAQARQETRWHPVFGPPVMRYPEVGGVRGDFEGHRVVAVAAQVPFVGGFDFFVPEGTPVHPMAAGTVRYAAREATGLELEITHGTTRHVTEYGHLSQNDVRKDQAVERASPVSLSGRTGLVSLPSHLHAGIYDGSSPADIATRTIGWRPYVSPSQVEVLNDYSGVPFRGVGEGNIASLDLAPRNRASALATLLSELPHIAATASPGVRDRILSADEARHRGGGLDPLKRVLTDLVVAQRTLTPETPGYGLWLGVFAYSSAAPVLLTAPFSFEWARDNRRFVA